MIRILDQDPVPVAAVESFPSCDLSSSSRTSWEKKSEHEMDLFPDHCRFVLGLKRIGWFSL